LANYATIAGTTPTSSELIWLPGVGTITASTSVTCETIYIPKNAGLALWSLKSDNTGVCELSFKISTGSIYSYGVASKSVTTIKDFSFSPSYPLVGLYGYEDTTIMSFGVITYNSTLCPKDP